MSLILEEMEVGEKIVVGLGRNEHAELVFSIYRSLVRIDDSRSTYSIRFGWACLVAGQRFTWPNASERHG